MLRSSHLFRICTLGCGLALAPFAPSVRAESVIHSFAGGSDGSYPNGSLIKDTAGNLYGTTEYGGGTGCSGNGCGTVFKVAPDGTESIRHAFAGGSDGSVPAANLIADSAGNFYSTTYYGGAHNAGTVFKLAPNGTETVLYSFSGGSDGGYPSGGLSRNKAGYLYSTTEYGGTGCSAPGCGTAFKLAPNGTEIVLHSFAGFSNDGAFPQAGLAADGAGNFYGATYQGGSGTACGNLGCGAIFKLAPNGTEKLVHSFTGYPDGESPITGSMVRDSFGNFYGTTYYGGAHTEGAVFKLATDGTVSMFYSFTGGGDGGHPYSGLIENNAGVYGTTLSGGGACGCGVVFKLSLSGTETTLHTFTTGGDGAYPQAGLIYDRVGNLYGTTYKGGAHGYGTVFKLRQ